MPLVLKLIFSLSFRSILKFFLQLKENYFGYYQKFVPMQKVNEKTTSLIRNTEPARTSVVDSKATTATQASQVEEKFDPRVYRPLAVKVAITLHDIHGHLVKVIS